MKSGRTIQEVGAEILRQSKAKEDYLVNTASIAMEDWEGLCSTSGASMALT